MNKRLSIFDDPYREWAVVAEELMEQNPDATMWDLIEVMYEYKTGASIPEFPGENAIVELHMLGMSAKNIADKLETRSEVIADVLRSIGFAPFRYDLPVSVTSVGLTAKDHDAKEIAGIWGITVGLVDKLLTEYGVWALYNMGEI